MATLGKTIGISLLVALAFLANAEARTKRSQSAKVEFKVVNSCPATGATKGPCSGYVIDHMWPLACGGEDHPRNMQWQTIENAKEKDKWERKMCGL